MRKLALIALIAIAGGAFYLIRDVGHIPLFDANLQVLAESEVEGYCAGLTFWSNRGSGNAAEAAACRNESDRSTDPDLTRVPAFFCMAVREAGFAGTVDECLGILDGQKLWPTRDGDLTNSWSQSAPYPGDLAFVVPPSDSRTGTREGFDRGDEAPPTTTTTTGAE
jgi:hypothetical protein